MAQGQPEDLTVAQVHLSPLGLPTNEAIRCLGNSETRFRRAVAAGWLVPAFGGGPHSEAVYAVADLDDLWDRLCEEKPPLRPSEVADRARKRARKEAQGGSSKKKRLLGVRDGRRHPAHLRTGEGAVVR